MTMMIMERGGKTRLHVKQLLLIRSNFCRGRDNDIAKWGNVRTFVPHLFL